MRYNAQTRSRPTVQGWSARTGSVPKTTTIEVCLGKFLQFFSEIFVTTPVHVLCRNFQEIGRWEVGETMRCFGDKNVFSPQFCPVWRRGQTFAEERAALADVFKISSQPVPGCRSYFRKSDFVYDRNICLLAISSQVGSRKGTTPGDIAK